jgi:hypothetical protein
MAFPTNCTCDVYRGYSPVHPADPPNRPAVLKGVSGYLRHHVRAGRFGYFSGQGNAQAPLHWTNLLLLGLGKDVRDAYQSELVADTLQNGDTLLVADYPIAGTCTAFLVVLVQRRDRGLPSDHLRVYLDRARPTYGQVCVDPNDPGGIQTACCDNKIPRTLYAQVSESACLNLNFTVTLTYADATQFWSGSTAFGGTGSTLTVQFSGPDGGCRWTIQLSWNTGCGSVQVLDAITYCDPFESVFGNIVLHNCFGCPDLDFLVTVTE